MDKIDQTLSKEKRILMAAEQVFSRKGYSQATLDEIISIADTGKGTVYKYYKNKEMLFYTLIKEKNDDLVAELKKAVSARQGFVDRFTAYYKVFAPFLLNNKVLWSVTMFEIMAEQAGWRLRWDSQRMDYVMEVLWGKGPTREEVAVKVRYAEILRQEIIIMEEIFREGIDSHFLMPIPDLPMMTQNIYFSICMMCFQGVVNFENQDKFFDHLLNRFLFGHAYPSANQ